MRRVEEGVNVTLQVDVLTQFRHCLGHEGDLGLVDQPADAGAEAHVTLNGDGGDAQDHEQEDEDPVTA